MKRTLKIITFILSLVFICSVFTGCVDLDEMRSAYGVINEDGSITFDGDTYLLLENADSYQFDPITNDMVLITEPDVPVLLSNTFSKYMGGITDDRTVMALHSFGLFNDDYTTDTLYYCREDKYAEVSESLAKEPEAEVYFYNYTYYDKEEAYKTDSYILTEEERAAVDEVLNSPSPERVYTGGAQSYADLYQGSRDLLFAKEKARIYYIDGGYVVTDSEENGYVSHKVPAELNSVFDKIMEMQFMSDANLEEWVDY